MKRFLVLVVGLLSAVNACTVTKISSDPVKEIEFDVDNYEHVISVRNSTDVLTLRDKNHKVLREIEVGVAKSSYLITSTKLKVFFMVIKSAEASSPNNGSCQGTLYDSNKGSLTSRVFDNLKCDGGKSFVDSDNILFINTVEGVSLVRKDETTPIRISNLENYTFHHIVENTYYGHVFVASNEPDSIYVITNEKKLSSTPSAKKVNKDRKDRTVYKFVYRGHKGMPAAIFTKNDNTGMDFEFLLPDGLETWMLTPGTNPYYGHVGRNWNYVFFVEINRSNVTKLCRSTKSGRGFDLDLGSCTIDKKKELIATDKDTNVYVACNEGLLYIDRWVDIDSNPAPRKISIPNNEVIEALAAEPRTQRVWILAKNLFQIEPYGNFNVYQKSDLSFTGLAGAPPILKINFDFENKFIGAQSGLYVCE